MGSEHMRTGDSEHGPNSIPVDWLVKVLGEPADRILSARGIPASPEDVAYVSGSLLDGLGNRGSDVDVYVVTEARPSEPLQIDEADYTINVDYIGKRRIDYEYWRPQVVSRIAERLRESRLGRGFAGTLHYAERTFIHRIKIGIPVINDAGFQELRSRFDFSHFQGYLVQDAIRNLDNALDDLCGMLDDDDREVALFRARDVLHFAIDAWTSNQGNTNPNPKWRVKLLRCLASNPRSEELLRDYLRLQFAEGEGLLEDRSACRRHLEECIDFADRITHWIQP